MDSLTNSKKSKQKPLILEDSFWDKYQKHIIAGVAASLLLLIIIMIASSGGDAKSPVDPQVIDDFKMSPQCLNEENAEHRFSHKVTDTDTWVEDIAANHDYFFMAEGCLNQTQRLSVYDPISKQLVKTV